MIRSSWDLQAALQQQQQQQQQQRAGSSLQQSQHSSAATGGSSRVTSAAGSVRGSHDSVAAAPAAQPAGRKQAFLSRFQPMGVAANLSAAGGQGEGGPAPQQQQAAGATGSRPSSALRRSTSIDENLGASTAAAAARGHQLSGETWRAAKAARGSRSSADFAELGAAQLGAGAAAKRGSADVLGGSGAGGMAMLADSTNQSTSGYLQRLAAQRAQQAYSSATASQFRR